MGESPETPPDPKPRVVQEYEDPQYHDEDEVIPPEDGPVHTRRLPGRKPPAPQPRRRYYED